MRNEKESEILLLRETSRQTFWWCKTFWIFQIHAFYISGICCILKLVPNKYSFELS